MAHVTARVDPAEEARAVELLPPSARPLFLGMPVADRRHALKVAARLLVGARADVDVDVVAAALLHDAAKGHRMRVWHRVAGVVLDAVAPRLLRRLARRDPASWRYPFHLYLHHASLSSAQALAAGCSPRTAALIRGDVHPADAPVLAALRAADDAA